LPGLSEPTRHRLRRLADKPTDVAELVPGASPPPWTPTRLNQRYQPALHLAEFVLASTSPDPDRGGNAAMNGFVLDMEDVFERFLTRRLHEALAARGFRGHAQERRHRLDEARRITIKPDITVYRRGRLVAVADAKYATLAAGKPDNGHVYQLVAYCTGLGLAHGHLIYAAGEPALTAHVIRFAGMVITAHALDLNQAPEGIAVQIEAMAEWIVRTR